MTTPKGKGFDGPEDSKSVRTRKRILDAAAKVLSRNGYAGSRLSDIAEEAELQAPAIYYYFASRELLVEEVMWVGSQQTREHVKTVLEALPDGTSPIDRILAAVEAHLRQTLEISDYATAVARNAGQIPDHIRERQALEFAKYGQVWNELITSAADANDLREGLDPYVARMLVVGALNWAPEWWDNRRKPMNVLIRNAQIIIRNGLARDDVPSVLGVSNSKPSGR